MRAFWLCLFLIGCQEKNPNYCPDQPDNLCQQIDAAEHCSSTKPCSSGVCKDPPGVCVECTMTSQCTTLEEPVCNQTTNMCDKCSKHSDCPMSDVCLPSGACAVAEDVLYVSSTGTDNATCAKGAPCATVTGALAVTPMTKSIIRVTGTSNGPTAAITGRDVVILGDTTTKLTTTGTEVIRVDTSSKVRLYDLSISDNAAATGVVAAGTHTGEIELQHCTLNKNLYGLMIAGSGKLILGRSTVSLNPQGGVVITGSATKFDVTNNYIFRNGNKNDSLYGGIDINTISGTGCQLQFNTIVDNDTTTGGTKAGGVKCDITGFMAPNNIIARNKVGDMAGLTNSQTLGVCSFTSSIVQPDMTGLLFKQADTQPYDYKLTMGSTAAIDQAMGGAQLTEDNDGQKRPNGTFRDIGADEFYTGQ